MKEKLVKIITSCETQSQLETAKQAVKNCLLSLSESDKKDVFKVFNLKKIQLCQTGK